MNVFSQPLYLLPPLVAVISVILLLGIIRQAASRNASVTIFSGVLVAMGLFTGLILGMRLSPDAHTALVWNRMASVPGFAIWVLYYHFSLTYTGNKGRRIPLYIAYAVLFIIIALSPTELITRDVTIESYGYKPEIGTVGLIMAFFGLVFMFGGAWNLFRQYRKSHSYEEKNRLLYLILALVFPLVGAFMDGFTDLPPAAIWGNLIFFGICTLVIVKYQLLDIRLALRKSISYILASIIVAVPYTVTLVLVTQFLGTRIEGYWIHGLAVFILAIALRPLSNWAERRVDKLFFRDRYDYLEALERFTHETQSIQNLKALSETLIRLVQGALRSSFICLLLPSEENDNFISISQIGLDSSPLPVILNSENPVVKEIVLSGNVIERKELDELLRQPTPDENKPDNSLLERTELLVPLKTRQGKLSGIMMLGLKLSQQLYSTTETGLLITLSNQMAIALENAHLYDTERKLRLELEKQNQQKSEFLNMVAHEMKTPLTSFISSSELLGEKLVNSDNITQRLIGNLRRSADNMDRRVSELLELARTQNRELKLEMEMLDIDEILADAVSNLRLSFEGKKQKLLMTVQELPQIMADRSRLDQILYNLLSNANKFSPDAAIITIVAGYEDQAIRIEIHDQAPAITEEEKTKIFEPYYRGEDTGEQYATPGLGLGLYITKELVELHKGKIWVESSASGNNVFIFTLPIIKQIF